MPATSASVNIDRLVRPPLGGDTPSPGPGSARDRRRGRGNLVAVWRVLRANPLTLAGALLVGAIVLAAIVIEFVPLLTELLVGRGVSVLPYGPNQLNPNLGATPPSSTHWLGTDELGRDMFSRVMAALPLDLAIGLSITGFAVLLGGSLGLVAGYWDRPRSLGGAASTVILRVTDIFLAFPTLVLALAIAATLGRGIVPSIIALSVTWWPYYVRLVRGEVLTIKHLPYIAAARAAGVPEVRILLRHVVRNLLEPLTVYYTLDVGSVLVTFSTISFIGIGSQPGVPEWGSMVEFYNQFVISAPWTVLAPGFAIFLAVLAFSLLGDGVREVLDPRSLRAAVAR